MKHTSILVISFLMLSATAFFSQKTTDKFPYKDAGLTERQAAEHLLSRFTFGVRQGDIDAAVNMGLEKWFSQQLQGNISDQDVDKRLESYTALRMSNQQIVEQFPLGAQLRNRAIKDGLIDKNNVGDDKSKLNEVYKQLSAKYGIQHAKELERQTVNQKVIRAIYSKNQLHEVLTDFWFNHFNVFMGKNQSTQFVMAYERDAIRPNVTNKFKDLLMATTRSPAMLTYLDNFLSSKEDDFESGPKMKNNKRPKGLNENYAREIMELHTLGVDGGYTQADVLNAAKILTGWTIYPMRRKGEENKIANLLDKIGEDRLASRGFIHEGDFLFASTRHESGTKMVLGKVYDQGGYAEGVALLNDLASHASTAQFICKKIATRFVSDEPDQKLVNIMTKTFTETDGDISKVLLTMVSSLEFWNGNSLRQKTKSPFEYAISAVRSLNADVKFPMPLANWITKMGQKVYYYQAPTGFPDKGQYWINTGSLLNRMNFGLDLAGRKIGGIQFDIEGLLDHKEPESARDAIDKYAHIMLPERNTESTVSRLMPLVSDPDFSEKVVKANKNNKNNNDYIEEDAITTDLMTQNNQTLAQVIGILIGSPEFQRK